VRKSARWKTTLKWLTTHVSSSAGQNAGKLQTACAKRQMRSRLSNFEGESGVYAMRSLKGHSSVVLRVSGVLSTHTIVPLTHTRHVCNWAVANKQFCLQQFAHTYFCILLWWLRRGLWHFFLTFFAVRFKLHCFRSGWSLLFLLTHYSAHRVARKYLYFFKNFMYWLRNTQYTA